ncbi:MAG: acetate/propionate family kinase, partial [Actinomycetota bacterium]
MRVLVVNAGSSTLKLQVVGEGDRIEEETVVDPWDGQSSTPDLDRLGPVDAVGHRVVHGGDDFVAPTVVTDEVVEGLRSLTPLAPLHQPRALAALEAARASAPDVAHVACFDTAFHATL